MNALTTRILKEVRRCYGPGAPAPCRAPCCLFTGSIGLS